VRIVDSFESYPLGSIHGNGQGGDGWLAPWSGNATIVDVSAKPLAAAGLSGGNKAIAIPNSSEAAVRIFNQEYDLTGTTGKEFFVSWLCRIDLKDPTKIPTTGSLWLYTTSGNPDWGIGGISITAQGGDHIAGSYYQKWTAGGPKVSYGQTALIVMRAGKGTIDLWVNPTSAADKPALTHTPSFKLFPGIGVYGKYDMKSSPIKQMLIDRIVIGESFASAISGTLNQTVSAQPHAKLAVGTAAQFAIRRSASGLVVENLPDNAQVRLLTLQGKSILTATQRTKAPLSVPLNRAPGMYLLHISLPDGTAITRSVMWQR
jgi:hypothetical protein